MLFFISKISMASRLMPLLASTFDYPQVELLSGRSIGGSTRLSPFGLFSQHEIAQRCAVFVSKMV